MTFQRNTEFAARSNRKAMAKKLCESCHINKIEPQYKLCDRCYDKLPKCTECVSPATGDPYKIVSQKVADFSMKKYGRVVCFDCQEKLKVGRTQ